MSKKSQGRIKGAKRLYLVNRDFQFRYINIAVFVGVVSTLLTTSVILIPLYQFEILRIPRFLPWPILVAMVVAVIINISLVGFVGLFVTHRIAGPIYAMVRSFREIEDGIIAAPMRVRDGDDLKYLVRSFNGMVSGLRRRASDELEVLSKLAESTKGWNSEGAAESKALLKQLEKLYLQRLGKEDMPH